MVSRCWTVKLVSRLGLRAPASATLNKPTATASCPASRQPHKSGRNTGRFSSSHSQPYRYRSTISLPKPVTMLGQVLSTAPTSTPSLLWKPIFILMGGFNQAIRHSRRSGNPEPFISKDLVGIRSTPRLSAKETSPVWTTPALSQVFGCGKRLWIPATMERLFSSSWVALTKPSVILAAAGIQSPLSQKTWSGYAGRLASRPKRPVQCGPLLHCPTYLDVGKSSGFPLRRE